MFRASVALGAMAAVIAEKNTMTTGRPCTSVLRAKMGPNPCALPMAHPTTAADVEKASGDNARHTEHEAKYGLGKAILLDVANRSG